MEIRPIMAMFALLSISSMALADETLLTGFGSSDTQPFTLTFSDGTFNQGSAAATWTSSGFGQVFRGTFSSVNLSSMGTPDTLRLDLNFNTIFSGTIDCIIGSSIGNQLGYSATASGLTGNQLMVFSRNVSLDAGSIVLSTVTRVALTVTDPNMTVDGLFAVSPIPEPAACSVLFGIAVLGFGSLRRRRTAPIGQNE
jgi:hypothetical protein